MPKISIIIPTRDRSQNLKRCIASINKYTKDYEVILVTDNMGFNAKLNKGFGQAKGEYLILLHDDHEVTEGWADTLADVGSFRQGELGNQFDHWGGYYRPFEEYCTNPLETPDYPSMFVLAREAWQKIGKLDEFYEEPGFQDVDLGYQIKKAGFKIKCLPGKIIHWGVRTKPLDEKNREYLHRKWNLC